jgi:hypothetical protein
MKQISIIHAVTNRKFFMSILSAVSLMAIFFISGDFARADSTVSDSHTLTATTSGQGIISPAGAVTVPEGGGRSFVFDSDENHRLVDLIVDGTSIGPVDAFSFENISASHTIEAVFERRETVL